MNRWGKRRAWRWWGRRSRPRGRRFALRTGRFERLQERILLCGDGNLADALPIAPTGVLVERLSAGEETTLFTVTLTEPGRLTIQTRPKHSTLATRTSLLSGDRMLLMTSDGQSADDPNDLIAQHLLAGTYFVEVEGLSGASGDFALATQFDPATPPSEPLAVSFDRDYPFAVSPPYHVAGDFNGDGHLDLATPNTWTSDVSILLGLGDGSFQSAHNFAVGFGPFGIAAADFNRDGRLDVATVNQNSNDVSVLLATGNETLFAAELRGEPIHGFGSATGVGVGGPSGAVSWGMSAGDFNGDGRPDLVFANLRTNDVSVLLGEGDGTFLAERRFDVGTGPNGVLAADLNADGRTDVVTANFNSNSLSLLLGVGDGTFQPQRRIETGPNPSLPMAADLNRDGRIDLAMSMAGSDEIWIFWNQGAANFSSPTRHAVGRTPYGLVALDFNRDGVLDLATSNRSSNDVSVLLGRGDGTFAGEERYRVGLQPWNVVAGDFNGDGQPDLSTANARSHDVSILLGLGDGTFLQDATDSRQQETNPQGMVARDFNHDGLLDLAAVTYTGRDAFVFLGRGDGTFQERMRFNIGSTPLELLSEDFNRDGHSDLASINCDSGDLSVLLGRGDGTFQDQVRYPSSVSGEWGLTADFNGDGFFDLVASGQFASGIAILLGRGDGTFGERAFFDLDEAPADGAAGDFNGDGRLDLATTNFFAESHDVSIHVGRGDGTFDPPQHFAVGEAPLGIVAADFNRDGHLDLASANFRSQSISLLLGRGDATFAPEVRYATGLLPDFLLTSDFDGDGRLDLVVSNAGTEYVSVLRGRADGTFADHVLFPVGGGPTPRRGLDAGDFNGDGRVDLAIPQVLPNDIAVLLGSGDALFAPPLRFPVGLGPVALTAGDFSGDGRLDVATVNPNTSELTLSLGSGDTTLHAPRRFPVGAGAVAVIQGDFNRDGRLDLATANQGDSDLSVLLGTGAGNFQEQPRLAVGANPVALAGGDFNGDGRMDLAAANATSGDVSILLGRGDGTFRGEQRVAAGDLPQALATGDFNRDGRLDLAAANYRGNDVSLLLGRGDGTFEPPISLPAGSGPVALLTGDFNLDGALDLATANFMSNDLSLLLGRGDGSFGQLRFAAGAGPVSLTGGDHNSDGRLDLASANSRSDDLTLLLGRGDGTFGEPLSLPAGDYPAALVSADFNGDARSDFAVATQLSDEVSMLQGLGDGTFAAAGTIPNRRRATPLVADMSGDGLADVALLDLAGRILVRTARAGAAGIFEAPRIVNPGELHTAHDFAVVSAQDGSVLGALDAQRGGLSFYSRQADGTFARQAGPHVPGKLPVAIRSADLNGDGRNDLAVAAAGSNQVFVYLQSAAATVAGGFGQREPDFTLETSRSPSALELTDVDGDGRLDILVTSQFSGDVSVFYNHADEPFSCAARFATSTGLHSLIEQEGGPAVRSFAAPSGMATGQFGSDGLRDLVVANSGANSLVILPGSGIGGFLNPAQSRTLATGHKPTAVVAGHFNGDSLLDAAVLNEGSADLSIFLGQNGGGLTPLAVRPAAGNSPTGLTVLDANSDGRLDLLIGNDFGDLLMLLGNGDGSFQPYQRADGQVSLAVADLDGDGLQDFIFASHANDTVEVQYAQAEAFRQVRSDGLLAPAAVNSADLNRDGVKDLVIANSGANNVLVYLGAGGGQFGPPQRFFAGTRPVGAEIEDLNQDGLADVVVANEGSNDVTILLGQITDGQWTLASGPRLIAGLGPVQTLVRDETDDGLPDILVTNAQSNDVFLLAGLGLGFFDDRNPLVRPTGQQPSQMVDMGAGVATINQGSNDITFFPNFATSPGFDFASGGQRPVAGLFGDFDGDRINDLLVAHQGDGVVRLLAGGPEGFSLSDSFTHAELPHPAAIASVFRGQQIDVYGVNERGNKAVLIAALAGSLPTSPALPPLPIAALLFVIAPGVELALGGFNPALFLSPARPSRSGLENSPVTDAAQPLAEGTGDELAEQPPEGEQEADREAVDEQKAHDAAIAELLSGVSDALSQRPPKLPAIDGGLLGQPHQPDHSLSPVWPSRILAWAAEIDLQRLVEWLPIPLGVAPALVGLAAAAREWFWSGAACTAQETTIAGDEKQIAELKSSRIRNDDRWPLDPRVAAILALSLLQETASAAGAPNRRPKKRT